MSQSWYAKHNGKIVGPITSAQLKQLVGSGKINAETDVRLGDDGKWMHASSVKGLLQKTNPQQQHSSLPPARSTNLKTSPPEKPGTIKRAQPEAANPYQSPAFSEAERPDPPAANTRRLKTTRAGLYTVYYGICAVLFAIGVGILLGILGDSIGIPVLMILAEVVAIAAGFGGSIAILVGQILCLTVPRESGGKGHVQIAVAIQASSILLAIGSQVTTAMMLASGSVDPTLFLIGSIILGIVNYVMVLVGYVCFLYFIKNLALYIGRTDLASSSSTVMKLMIAVAAMLFVFPVMAILLSIAVPAIGRLGGIGIMLIMLIIAITLLITFIRYANLVGYLARAIPK